VGLSDQALGLPVAGLVMATSNGVFQLVRCVPVSSVVAGFLFPPWLESSLITNQILVMVVGLPFGYVPAGLPFSVVMDLCYEPRYLGMIMVNKKEIKTLWHFKGPIPL
jgi:hypothetical protein